MLNFDFNTYQKPKKLKKYNKEIFKIKETLKNGGEMLDWYNIDNCISYEEVNKIKTISEYIKNNCELFIVVGIGGSFLGAKAIINALTPYFNKTNPEIIFAGTSLSGTYLDDLLNYMQNKQTIINVISKSGTTLETIETFTQLFQKMKQKYNDEELKQRIIITTDEKEGKLRILANSGFTSFNIPRQIGGRYSVLTTVGLLPIAVSGINIDNLLEGAKNYNQDKAFEYAIIRDILYKKKKFIEIFSIYEPKLQYFGDWLKQLFSETQGKNKKGIFPSLSINTRDLHSLGQFYQDGNPIIFETVINYKTKNNKLEELNQIAVDKVAEAHFMAGCESNIITLDELDELHLGMLIHFFEVAAATGGYLLHVNPFDQPGVNTYKDLLKKELKKGN